MQFIVGTSGYSYPGWKGSFYPPKLPQKEMLSFYAQRFATVELNNTFYRLPNESTIESWVGQVPGTFRFAVKAPQTITHRKRLKEVKAETEQLFQIVSAFDKHLGPLLFQLPPNLKKDLPRLEDFLGLIEGQKKPSAFEFRHESWFDDEVAESLSSHGCPLCLADMEDAPAPKLTRTANWGYVRLRRDNYSDSQIREWIKKLRSQEWREAFVYFKHDDVGLGAKLATRFVELAGE